MLLCSSLYQYIIIVTHIPECVNNYLLLQSRRFEVSRFAPSGRPRSGLTLTRDHSQTLPRKGQGSPLPLCLAASVKTGVKGDEVPLVGGVKGRAKPTPCKGVLRLAKHILAKK